VPSTNVDAAYETRYQRRQGQGPLAFFHRYALAHLPEQRPKQTQQACKSTSTTPRSAASARVQLVVARGACGERWAKTQTRRFWPLLLDPLVRPCPVRKRSSTRLVDCYRDEAVGRNHFARARRKPLLVQPCSSKPSETRPSQLIPCQRFCQPTQALVSLSFAVHVVTALPAGCLTTVLCVLLSACVCWRNRAWQTCCGNHVKIIIVWENERKGHPLARRVTRRSITTRCPVICDALVWSFISLQ